MTYTDVSVEFPEELHRELERFLEETDRYANESEFIEEAVRRHLLELNDEPAIAALRVEQLLARAEQDPVSDDELRARLEDLRGRIDEADRR
ncbi:ribbon-helix-helix domain-containing protein [Natrialbaceae archaeon GCM10025810]|uniref:ribbon-helix-helix domain-containing protein n=1 Tax=Halovalidus salilacus TaxID=3075124 RepID=UPI003622E1AA